MEREINYYVKISLGELSELFRKEGIIEKNEVINFISTGFLNSEVSFSIKKKIF